MISIVLLYSALVTPISVFPQQTVPAQIFFNDKVYPLFPVTLDELPEIPSPFSTEDGVEILVVSTRSEEYALIPVTIENGSPLLYSRRIGTHFGKDNQLQIDSGDFPVLARTGLHSDTALDNKNMLTGYPISLISYIGRPGRFSGTGFMADDEDIISVLKGDNHLVRQLGLIHPQMAKPLFHVWNMILKEIEVGTMRRFPSVQHIYYNGKTIRFSAEGGKGWQVSIFQDEIQGRFNIQVNRKMSPKEKSFLSGKYSDLTSDQIKRLEENLSTIRFSEMAPYYIMRYGFYEGHTAYRSDPIAIAFVFGLRSLEKIETAFKGKLYQALIQHFQTP